jgi:hypothetical protein
MRIPHRWIDGRIVEPIVQYTVMGSCERDDLAERRSLCRVIGCRVIRCRVIWCSVLGDRLRIDAGRVGESGDGRSDRSGHLAPLRLRPRRAVPRGAGAMQSIGVGSCA